jgi:hypothetical protein
MSKDFTIAGNEDDWNIFSRTVRSGQKLLIRSRTGNAALSAFAAGNFMARLRCVIPPDAVNAAGMPESTAALDAFEDSLIGALEAASAEVYQLAVTTGEGNRDLYFTARDGDDLRAAIKAATCDEAIKLQFAPIGDRAAFLKVITLSPEEAQAARGRRVPD